MDFASSAKPGQMFSEPTAQNSSDVDNDTTTNQHWVTQVFPPTYFYQDDNLWRDSCEEIKSILGNRYSVNDPENLRKVFYRIHALMQEETLNETRKQDNERKWLAEAEADLRSYDGTLTSAHSLRRLRSLTMGERAATQGEKPCIWNESEIGILRKANKTQQDENQQLKANFSACEMRLTDLETRYHNSCSENDHYMKKLSEATQKITRQQIALTNLKEDFKSAQNEIDQLTKIVQSMMADESNLRENYKNTQIEFDKERLKRYELEGKVHQHGRAMIDTAVHLEQKLKQKYEHEISKLHREIQNLKSELSEEKSLHDSSKRGLDQLRSHFISLPLKAGLSGADDELSKLTIH